MRNTPLGDFRLTSALSARAVEIASEIGGVNHVHCPLRAREGAVSRPTRPSRRWRRADRAACAGCRRLLIAGIRCGAAVAEFCSFYESRIGADDGARANAG